MASVSRSFWAHSLAYSISISHLWWWLTVTMTGFGICFFYSPEHFFHYGWALVSLVGHFRKTEMSAFCPRSSSTTPGQTFSFVTLPDNGDVPPGLRSTECLMCVSLLLFFTEGAPFHNPVVHIVMMPHHSPTKEMGRSPHYFETLYSWAKHFFPHSSFYFFLCWPLSFSLAPDPSPAQQFCLSFSSCLWYMKSETFFFFLNLLSILTSLARITDPLKWTDPEE